MSATTKNVRALRYTPRRRSSQRRLRLGAGRRRCVHAPSDDVVSSGCAVFPSLSLAPPPTPKVKALFRYCQPVFPAEHSYVVVRRGLMRSRCFSKPASGSPQRAHTHSSFQLPKGKRAVWSEQGGKRAAWALRR
ncbi:hypothetical protein MRX96_003346 [Rhipicephalus microplus]